MQLIFSVMNNVDDVLLMSSTSTVLQTDRGRVWLKHESRVVGRLV